MSLNTWLAAQAAQLAAWTARPLARRILRDEIASLSGALATAESARVTAEKERDAHLAELRTCRTAKENLDARIRPADETDGRIWQGMPVDHSVVPRFAPFVNGRAPIISVINLKGGVGKSTIAVNLGATLSTQGSRVLLADLDFQATLTSLCLTAAEIEQLGRMQQFLGRLFADAPLEPAQARALLHAMNVREGERQLHILGANEAVLDLEHRMTIRWIVRGISDDVRFRLRQALRCDEIQPYFDAILLDCSPRPTVATVNALACSDFVLIPTLLDAASVERVPALLAWIRGLQNCGVCPGVKILGVVANAVEGDLDGDLWQRLKTNCGDRWGLPIHMFGAHIKKRKAIARSGEQSLPAVWNDRLAADERRDIRDQYQRLAQEVWSRTQSP